MSSLGLALLMGFGGMLYSAPSANANPVNCSMQGNYHVGYAQFGHPAHPSEGVSSYIEVFSPDGSL
jgi:hypothetical protein